MEVIGIILPQFNELLNSYWISHTKLISDDEAINGGNYLFQKKIRLSRVSLIDTAMIYFVVDNKCNISINANELGTYDGYDNLHAINIRDNLKNGENILDFNIYNDPGLVLSTAKYSNKIGTKGELNPYGIKYLIRIIYK